MQLFLLDPDPVVVAAFMAALRLAAWRCGVELLGVCQMSNHYHLVVHDPEGRYPEFVAWLNARMTRRINAHRGRKDTLWEARQTSVVELGDADAVLEALAYIHLNPLAAGLVEEASEWAGVLTGPEDYLPRTDGSGLQLCVPPTHARLGPAAFADLLRARIDARARWLRAAGAGRGRPVEVVAPWNSSPSDGPDVPSVPSQGWDTRDTRDTWDSTTESSDTSEAGTVPSVPSQGWDTWDISTHPGDGPTVPSAGHDSPPTASTGRRPRRINPTVKASSPERRFRMLTRLQRFRCEYAIALAALREGRRAVFPGGAWSLPRLINLSTEPEPLPAWRLD
jgi:REP element-mobilizing transposase RayT